MSHENAEFSIFVCFFFGEENRKTIFVITRAKNSPKDFFTGTFREREGGRRATYLIFNQKSRKSLQKIEAANRLIFKMNREREEGGILF